MSDKYTYADVIIDPEDPRVEIGKEYYSSKNIPDALFKANEGDEMFCYKLLSVHDGAYGPHQGSPAPFCPCSGRRDLPGGGAVCGHQTAHCPCGRAGGGPYA